MAQGHITGYWWTGRINFGDLLTPLLIQRFANLTVEWSPVKSASIVCVGSILDMVPKEWGGIVLGSGKLRESSLVDLSSAKVLALRGPLTAAAVNAKGDYVLGDPGLLADELVTGVTREHHLGIVPHWSDTKLELRKDFLKYDPLIIHASDPPLEVIRKIGSCRKIVASSLHGIILADAFGIPRRTEMTPQFAREGGDYKFRDYNESVSVEFKVGVTQEARLSKVRDRQHELYDVFTELSRMLK
jgi:pyruvyltransferase